MQLKKGLSVLLLSSLLAFTGCSVPVETPTEAPTTEPVVDASPKVRMTLSNDMVINLELYPEIAPKTVENFLKYVDDGFYEGVIFHRVIENFMIQAGGYYLDGKYITPKEDLYPPIVGEFTNNGFENNLKHEPGVLSTARTSIANSATSQFFICSATYPSLDGNYAAFGKTMDEKSLENVIEISKVKTVYVSASFSDFPAEPITIVSIKRI